jgi:tetratricopeptide (TPR) repeat protein
LKTERSGPMTKRQLLSSALSALLALSMAPAARAAQEEDGLATRQHDPFLTSVKDLLKNRPPTAQELAQLTDYIKKHPNDSDGHLVLANAYNRLGMDGMYAEELEKAWRLCPTALLYLYGALNARHVTEDIAAYDRLVEEAFERYKDDAKMLDNLGQLFQRNGQSKLAARYLKRAVELSPQDVVILCDYCKTLLALRQSRELIAATALLLADPASRPLGWFLRGVAWYNLNQYEKAVPLLAKAYQAVPDQAEYAEAYYDALAAAGADRAALLPALMALALQPPFSAHMNELKVKVRPVIAAASTADLQNGIMHVSRHIPPLRSMALFYFALGDVLDKSNRVLAARNCFNKGLGLDPFLGRAYMRLGRDCELLGGPPDQILTFYEQAALRAREDKEVIARYKRMKARMPARERDIANKIKCVINNVRYKS